MAVVGGDEFEHGMAARAQSHGEGPPSATLGPQQPLGLGGPGRRCPRRVGCPARVASASQLAAPPGVPEMPVQIEPETPVGMRVRMVPGGAASGLLPQGQGHPLSGVRPGRRGTHHQMQRRGTGFPVTGERDGEAGPEPPVGGDPGHVPAEQIRRQPTQIRTEAGDEFGAVAVAHGAQIEIDVDAGGSAGPGPVTGRTPRGRSLDHGQWHGVLAHALPHRQAGRNPVREVMCHQHSPCADDSPNPHEEKFFIGGIISSAITICQYRIRPRSSGTPDFRKK